jgi:HK97 family phage prohead protease
MSEAATMIEDSTEPAERPVLRRSFEAEITPGDGRTIDVRVIRYNAPATVADPPSFVTYREEWAPGVFDDQMQAANRLLANVEHELGIGGIVARGVSYSSDTDSLYATVRMLNGQDADKTLELVNDGVFGGISLEAFPKKSIRSATGVVRRVKAHLDKIAFCRRPAFEDAVVLAVRHEVIDEHVVDDELLPLDIDPATLERCRVLGVRLPERYKAHPAGTGTPAEPGTPEDGTRLNTTQANESSEE